MSGEHTPHSERLAEYAEFGGPDSTYAWALAALERCEALRLAVLDAATGDARAWKDAIALARKGQHDA